MALNISLLASSKLSQSPSRDEVKSNRKMFFSPNGPKRMASPPSLPLEKKEILKNLEDWAEKNILPIIKPVEKSWQPQDFLPGPWTEDFTSRIEELQARAMEIPDQYYVCLVGNMITEEALPTYSSMLSSMDGIHNEMGASPSPWTRWSRSWMAEENRHGDLLNKYLYLCGRVNMRQREKTIHYLISSGMNVGMQSNPYLGFIYTSFQERATSIAHGNTAKQAQNYGETNLAKICGAIASDEKRHEAAYSKITGKLFKVDPDAIMVAFADMMRKKIIMPGSLMYDGEDHDLFDHYSGVAQQLGIYTADDYVNIVEFFVDHWEVGKVADGLSSEGRKAQDFLCNLTPKLRKLVERTEAKKRTTPMVSFSWILKRHV